MACVPSRGPWWAAWPAVVGLLTAVVAVPAFAPPAAAQSAQQASSLQQLVDELGSQLWLAYRANVPEHQRRHEQLRQAIAAWNASSQSQTDRELMAAWLRAAMRSSMPGSYQPMPPLPALDHPAAPTASMAPAQSVTSQKPVGPDVQTESAESPSNGPMDSASGQPAAGIVPIDSGTGDPFRDDPAAE